VHGLVVLIKQLVSLKLGVTKSNNLASLSPCHRVIIRLPQGCLIECHGLKGGCDGMVWKDGSYQLGCALVPPLRG
jgi:hypothetical protein